MIPAHQQREAVGSPDAHRPGAFGVESWRLWMAWASVMVVLVTPGVAAGSMGTPWTPPGPDLRYADTPLRLRLTLIEENTAVPLRVHLSAPQTNPLPPGSPWLTFAFENRDKLWLVVAVALAVVVVATIAIAITSVMAPTFCLGFGC
jgi:hypothetical protein